MARVVPSGVLPACQLIVVDNEPRDDNVQIAIQDGEKIVNITR